MLPGYGLASFRDLPRGTPADFAFCLAIYEPIYLPITPPFTCPFFLQVFILGDLRSCDLGCVDLVGVANEFCASAHFAGVGFSPLRVLIVRNVRDLNCLTRRSLARDVCGDRMGGCVGRRKLRRDPSLNIFMRQNRRDCHAFLPLDNPITGLLNPLTYLDVGRRHKFGASGGNAS